MVRSTRKKILNSNYKLGFICCGGGTQFIYDLAGPGGSSQTFHYAQYITDAGSIIDYHPKPKAVSAKTAELLAIEAKFRASIMGDSRATLGIGCTAALTVNNEREGRENHAYVALSYFDRIEMFHVTFNAAKRLAQEEALSNAIKDIVREFLSNKELQYLSSVYGFVIEKVDYVSE